LELPAQTPFDTISLRDDRLPNAYGLGRGPLHHLIGVVYHLVPVS